MKYIIFTQDGYGCPLARRLQMEGNDILVGQIQNSEDMGIGESSYFSKKEKPENQRRRLSIYDGIFPKINALKLLEDMKSFKNKDDYFVIFDFNSMYKLAEKVLKMGYAKGIFPLEEDFNMEKDREKAKEFVKKYYPEIKVAEVHSFDKIQDGIEFINESDKFWVIKSRGNFGDTFVPEGDDIEFVKNQLISALEKESKDYEKGGFILEEKIIEPIEFIPSMAFWDGKPVYSYVEIETRPFGAGDIGMQTGGSLNLTCKTDLDEEINDISFPSIIYEMAKKRKGLFIADLGLLSDKNGNLYFTEFCGNRWGWGGIFSEMSMSREDDNLVTPYFEKLVNGENPFTYKYGSNISLYNIKPDSKFPELYEEGLNIQWKPEYDQEMFIYQMRMNQEKDKLGRIKKDVENKFVNVGYENSLIGWVTGYGNTIGNAADTAYEAILNFSFKEVYYRPKFDFLSKEYPTSILNRYEFLKKSGLISY